MKIRPGVRLSHLLLLLLTAGCVHSVPGGSTSGDSPLLPSIQVYTETERVNFVLQVTNIDTAAVHLEFGSGQSFDFVVSGEDAREIWRWSADQMFTQAERTELLAAGESARYEAEWNPPADLRGNFVAVGRLVARNHPVEQATRFDLR